MRRARLALTAALFVIAPLGFTSLGCSTETKFTGVDPNTGTFMGGEEVVLEGQNFPRSGVSVRFGFKEAQPVVTESGSKIRVPSPPGDKNTNVDVTLTFDDGRAFVLRNGFRYVDATQQRQTMDKFFDKASGAKK